MLYKYDQASDTDSEPSSSRGSWVPFAERSKQPIKKHVERRQYHNVLEQRRRNVLKNSFNVLLHSIPPFSKKKVEASRAKILKRAIKYIHRAEQKRPSRILDIRNLKRENEYLLAHCEALEQAEESGDMSNVDSILRSIEEIKQRVYVEDKTDTEEEEDDDDLEDAANGPAERRMDWSSDNDEENNEPQQEEEEEEEETSDAEEDEDDEGTDDGDLVPRMNWSIGYGTGSIEPEQDWSGNAFEVSDSSHSAASSDDSSSDNE